MDDHRSPKNEYGRRLESRRQAVSRFERREATISAARLAVAASAAVVGWAALRSAAVSWWWLVIPGISFLALVVVHDRTIRSRRRRARAVRFYQDGLARVEERWSGTGTGGEQYVDDAHPYATDLDLFGPGSMFELLDTARTKAGEETLAGWLLAPSTPTSIRERQEAVEELRHGLDLREDLALLGEDVRAEVDPERIVAWAEAPEILPPSAARLIAPAMAVLTVASLLGWWLADLGPLPSVVMLTVQGLYGLRYRGRVLRVFDAVQEPERDLELLSLVLERLETERFSAPRLVVLRGRFDTDGVPPSARIRRLARIVDLFNARRNQMFLPLSWILMWGTQFAFLVEAWRRRYGDAVGRWLQAVGELEAIGSVAGYAYEHPDDPFPEVEGDGPRIAGIGLGHPLIPADRCVRNDIELGGETCMWIVSGSNMSGKSTLLRTVGVNAVLAMAGAPVRARRLAISPLAIGATLRVQDSLQAGASRFYAEITRIRRIMDRAALDLPVLFLLDEILHGTNSHDRAIGAEAILRGLVDRGAIGLVTTHDLALSQLADSMAHCAANVHFEDHIEDGRMVFDYLMRPGTVRKSNALELMRSVGLDV